MLFPYDILLSRLIARAPARAGLGGLLLLAALSASGTAVAQQAGLPPEALRSATTFQDSIPITYSVLSSTWMSGVHQMCGLSTIGVFRDVLGTGNGRVPDSNYRVVGTRGRYLQVPLELPDPAVPGETISFYVGSSTGGCQSFNPGPVLAYNATYEGWALYSTTQRPVALFEWEHTEGTTVAFDGAESYLATAQGKVRPLASYTWDFGDGASGSGANQTHEYAEPGEYVATLTVADADGNEDAFSQTVTVTRHLLSVRVHSEVSPVGLEEEMLLVATVTNVGLEAVISVEVPPRFVVHTVPETTEYPILQQPVYTISPSDTDPVTAAQLAPGESIELRRRYRVDRAARYRLGTSSAFPWISVEVEVEATLLEGKPLGVSAETHDGEPVRVVNACESGGCENRTVIRPKMFDLAMEFWTDGLRTFEATAGLLYNPLLNSPRAEVQAFNYAEDGEPVCFSACVDVEVSVKDSETAEPLARAAVEFSAGALPDSINVTPDHTGGHFCTRTGGLSGWTCTATLSVNTDDEGRAHAIYSFPGIIADTEVPVTARVTLEHYVPAEVEEDIRLRANTRFDEEYTFSSAQAVWLNTNFLTYASSVASTPGGLACAQLTGALLDPGIVIRPSRAPLVHSAAFAIRDWICRFNPIELPWESWTGGAGTLAAANLYNQFQLTFNPPSRGLLLVSGFSMTGSVPSITYGGDYYDAVLEAVSGAAGRDLIRGGTRMRVQLTEVSWLEPLTALSGGAIQNMHLRIDVMGPGQPRYRVDSVLELGYDAHTHLLPSSGFARANDALRAQEEQIRLRELAERIADGDYLVINAGTPIEEYHQAVVSNAERAGGAFAPTEGIDQTVRLTRPLRYDHEAGAPIQVIQGIGESGPPPAPFVLPSDTVSAAMGLLLRWATGLHPASHYDVEIARDEAFADVLLSAEGVEEERLAFTEVEVGDLVYWRVRATNLLGTSPWSPVGLVAVTETGAVTSEEEPLASAEALTLTPTHPNPARGLARVAYTLGETGTVRVEVFDMLGRRVAVVVDDVRPAGRHEVVFDTSGMASGTYLLRASNGQAVATQRFSVLR
jgi:PKD repeat protein